MNPHTWAISRRAKAVPTAPFKNGTGAISEASFMIFKMFMALPSPDETRLGGVGVLENAGVPGVSDVLTGVDALHLLYPQNVCH